MIEHVKRTEYRQTVQHWQRLLVAKFRFKVTVQYYVNVLSRTGGCAQLILQFRVITRIVSLMYVTAPLRVVLNLAYVFLYLFLDVFFILLVFLFFFQTPRGCGYCSVSLYPILPCDNLKRVLGNRREKKMGRRYRFRITCNHLRSTWSFSEYKSTNSRWAPNVEVKLKPMSLFSWKKVSHGVGPLMVASTPSFPLLYF